MVPSEKEEHVAKAATTWAASCLASTAVTACQPSVWLCRESSEEPN